MNPDDSVNIPVVPTFAGVASEAGGTSPNGALVFTGTGDLDEGFEYGATVWYYR
jgi:hypothetical protein